MRVRRLVTLAIVAAMVAIMQLIAIPAVGAAGPNQERYPVPFTIDDANCESINEDITGIADFFVVTNTRVDNNGVTHQVINALATGTASDSTGTYRISYHNHQSNTILPDGTMQSLWNDTFSLKGTGAASGLHVGFTWRLTFNPDGSVAAVEQLNTRGDPIDPATLAPHCDPI